VRSMADTIKRTWYTGGHVDGGAAAAFGLTGPNFLSVTVEASSEVSIRSFISLRLRRWSSALDRFRGHREAAPQPLDQPARPRSHAC